MKLARLNSTFLSQDSKQSNPNFSVKKVSCYCQEYSNSWPVGARVISTKRNQPRASVSNLYLNQPELIDIPVHVQQAIGYSFQLKTIAIHISNTIFLVQIPQTTSLSLSLQLGSFNTNLGHRILLLQSRFLAEARRCSKQLKNIQNGFLDMHACQMWMSATIFYIDDIYTSAVQVRSFRCGQAATWICMHVTTSTIAHLKHILQFW